jgi:methionyl-tRNA formyltransferase
MSVVVFAYHDVGCRGIRVLHRLEIPIAAVYTHADDPTENTWFGSVRATCTELSIPVRVGADPHAPAELAFLRALQPDTFFSFYYRDLLRPELLAIPRHGGVNLHGSLLPRYRGRAPVNWQLLHGETRSGATLHYMVKRADAGDVVDQESFAIGPDDRPTDVFARLLVAAERVLERSALAVCDGTAPRARQLESNATVFGRRTPEDGRIDWRLAAADVRNLVRAVTEPYPGAFTTSRSGRVSIWWADLDASDRRPALAPGTVERAADGVFVSCGDRRLLRLARVEVPGRVASGAAIRELFADGERLGTEPAATATAVSIASPAKAAAAASPARARRG